MVNKDLARLEIRYTNTLSSVVLDDYRINSVKWNDIPEGKYMLHLVNKKDILQALGVDKTISDLETKLAECEKSKEVDKVNFLVNELEKIINEIIVNKLPHRSIYLDFISQRIKQLKEGKDAN